MAEEAAPPRAQDNARACHCHPNCRIDRPCRESEFCPYHPRLGAPVATPGPIAAPERPRGHDHALLAALRRCCLAGSTPADPVADEGASHPQPTVPMAEQRERACPCFTRIDQLQACLDAQQQEIFDLHKACTALRAARPQGPRRRDIWMVQTGRDGVKISQFLFSVMVVLSGLAVGFTSLVFASQVIFS